MNNDEYQAVYMRPPFSRLPDTERSSEQDSDGHCYTKKIRTLDVRACAGQTPQRRKKDSLFVRLMHIYGKSPAKVLSPGVGG